MSKTNNSPATYPHLYTAKVWHTAVQMMHAAGYSDLDVEAFKFFLDLAHSQIPYIEGESIDARLFKPATVNIRRYLRTDTDPVTEDETTA